MAYKTTELNVDLLSGSCRVTVFDVEKSEFVSATVVIELKDQSALKERIERKARQIMHEGAQTFQD